MVQDCCDIKSHGTKFGVGFYGCIYTVEKHEGYVLGHGLCEPFVPVDGISDGVEKFGMWQVVYF